MALRQVLTPIEREATGRAQEVDPHGLTERLPLCVCQVGIAVPVPNQLRGRAFDHRPMILFGQGSPFPFQRPGYTEPRIYIPGRDRPVGPCGQRDQVPHA